MAKSYQSTIPDYYISETFYVNGNKVTIHRNPHPDKEKQAKAIQEVQEILMKGVYRNLAQNGYAEKLQTSKVLSSVDECCGKGFEFVREKGNDFDNVYLDGKLIGYQHR